MENNPAPATEYAIFAGGCFWCTEAEFANVPGVSAVTPGYIGGAMANPTYEQVCTGKTGHTEAIRIAYDPAQTAYETLLDIFWKGIDPTDAGGQFFDRGSQYRTAVFYTTDRQRALAEASKQQAETMLKKPIATRIVPATAFYPAEEYHHDYHRKNPLRYQAYKAGSGRVNRLKDIWKEE